MNKGGKNENKKKRKIGKNLEKQDWQKVQKERENRVDNKETRTKRGENSEKTKMVHTDNNEKKKDKKEVKKKYSQREIFISYVFFLRREIQKEMTNPDTEGISQNCKKWVQEKGGERRVNEEEKKRRWRQRKDDG